MSNVSFILPFSYFHSVSLGADKLPKWRLEGYMAVLSENAGAEKAAAEKRITEAKGKPWHKKEVSPHRK